MSHSKRRPIAHAITARLEELRTPDNAAECADLAELLRLWQAGTLHGIQPEIPTFDPSLPHESKH